MCSLMVILTNRKSKPHKVLTQKFTFFCCLLCTLLVPSLGISAYLGSIIVRYVSGFKYFIYFFIIYQIVQFQFNLSIAYTLINSVLSFAPHNIIITPTIFYSLLYIFYFFLILDTFLSLQISFLLFKWLAGKRAKAIKSAIHIMNNRYSQ